MDRDTAHNHLSFESNRFSKYFYSFQMNAGRSKLPIFTIILLSLVGFVVMLFALLFIISGIPNEEMLAGQKSIMPKMLLPNSKNHIRRLLDQFESKTKDQQKKIILFWSPIPGFLAEAPKLGNCIITYNRKHADVSHAIVFSSNDLPRNGEYPIKTQTQKWIFNAVTPGINNRTEGITFDWTNTYSPQSNIPISPWFLLKDNSSTTDFAAEKKKSELKIAVYFEDIEEYNKLQTKINTLSKHVRIDTYGYNGSIKCEDKMSDCLKALEREYKFFFAMDKWLCKDYISRKFLVALRHTMIPVLWGGPPATFYKNTFPEDFNTYVVIEEEFASFKSRLEDINNNDAAFNELFRLKIKFKVWEDYTFYDRLCNMVQLYGDDKASEQFSNLDLTASSSCE